MSPLQSKMARLALKWKIRDLAKYAEVGVSTVQEFEKGNKVGIIHVEKLYQTIIKTEQIIFIGENGLTWIPKK